MSINLPSTRLSRSASMRRPSSHPGLSSAQLCSSRSHLALLQSPQCRGTRHFRTSSSPRKIKSLRQDANTLHQNVTSSKSSLIAYTTTRSLTTDGKNPPTSDQLRMDIQKRAEAAAARARARVTQEQQTTPRLGSLADNSLFADLPPQRSTELGDLTALSGREPQGVDAAALELRNPSNMVAALNPKPEARSRWQRRMVIRSVRQRGRRTKAVKIARTERSSLSKSHFFKTSMKKLTPLARQIAGKPIDEAILQMRFSKKKVAKEVREHLIQAKDEAIVARGMGLGHLEQDTRIQAPSPASTSLESSTITITEPQISVLSPPDPTPQPKYLPGTTIPTDPAHRAPTSIYISQAWINRGPYGEKADYRAFGRLNIMRPPHTGLSVLLKEEKTRAREAAEKETRKIRRRMGKNMWTQLPDRKVTRQGQYLLW